MPHFANIAKLVVLAIALMLLAPHQVSFTSNDRARLAGPSIGALARPVGSGPTSGSPDLHVFHTAAKLQMPAEPFSIDFNCSSPQAGFCAKAEAAAKRACARIAMELKIRRTINVAMTMFLPCGSANPPDSCPDRTSVGQAIPLQSFPVRHKDDGQVYLYPTALIKQTDLVPVDEKTGKDRLAFPKHDILARFNALSTYWFEGETLPMPPNARDLEFVITHELLHGMGFGTDNQMSLQTSPTSSTLLPWWDSTPPSVMPQPPDFSLESQDRKITNDPRFFYNFTRPFVWDRFLVVTPVTPPPPNTNQQPTRQQPVAMSSITRAFHSHLRRLVDNGTVKPLPADQASVGNKIVDVKTGKTVTANDPVYSPTAVLRALVADPAASQLMLSLHTAATTATTPGPDASLVAFDPSSWRAIVPQLQSLNVTSTRVPLETSLQKFASGSSLWHVQAQSGALVPDPARLNDPDSVQPGPDFLMLWTSRPLSFSQMMARVRGGNMRPSGIGPGIVSALVAIGYTPASAAEFSSRKEFAEVLPEAVGADADGAAAAGGNDPSSALPAKTTCALATVTALMMVQALLAWVV